MELTPGGTRLDVVRAREALQIDSIASVPLPLRVRQVAIQRSGVPAEEVDDLWLELKRYFILHLKYGNMPMTSAKVDALWHAFILNLDEYLEFCRKIGSVIMHVPNTPTENLESYGNKWATDFSNLYQREFGTLPEHWRGAEHCDNSEGHCTSDGGECQAFTSAVSAN